MMDRLQRYEFEQLDEAYTALSTAERVLRISLKEPGIAANVRDQRDWVARQLIPLIKAAVDAGLDVRVGNDNYRVIRGKGANSANFLIKFTPEPNWIGLHGREGTDHAESLNMEGFYIKETTG